MPNKIGTMTDFKYTADYLNTYKGTTKINIASTMTPRRSENRRLHHKLKKSYSECEYDDDMDTSFVNSSSPSSKRKSIEQGQSTLPRQTVHKHNSFTINDGLSDIKLQYQHDTLKSQYLLQQQQKLKEYKNDPNYNSSESSNENRVVGKSKNCNRNSSINSTNNINSNNKSTGTSSNTNSLRRKKGLSTLSLCSCDADTEVSEIK